jgi:hypothetical protein
MIFKQTPIVLIFSLFMTMSTAQAASYVTASTDKPKHFKLEQYRKGVAIHLTAGGKDRLFQLDTAGGVTVIAPSLASELGCKPWGAITGFHMTGNKISSPRCDRVVLRVADTELTVPVAAVMPVGVPESPLDGLLALDVFASKIITIDFSGGDMFIETSSSAVDREKAGVEIPAHMAREIGGLSLSMFIDVPAKQGPLRMELDSGNGGTILVSKPSRELVGLPTADDKPHVGAFPIAPGINASGVIFTPELVIDGNLGMPFLKNWIVTMDLKEGRVWLAPSTIAPPKGMGMPPPLPTQ